TRGHPWPTKTPLVAKLNVLSPRIVLSTSRSDGSLVVCSADPMVWPGLTLSVATSPAVEERESPLTTTLVKVQPARAFSSKTRLEPAAGRPLKVNVLLLPVPPAVVIETGLGSEGRRGGKKRTLGGKLNVSLQPIEFFTTSTVASVVSV